MALPVTLPSNVVSIYGVPSVSGIIPLLPGYQFGAVTSIYGAGAGGYVGSTVMFKIDNSVMIQHDNTQYFLLPTEDIILTENPPT